MEKAVITLALISCLYGCIGAQLSLPEQKNVRITPQQNPPERAWCGVTLWAVIPIPLKLPVCRSHPAPSPLYACGPFMFLGPIMHGYKGNALCGEIP